MDISGFNGWLLDRAAQIDLAYPGFFGHLFRASIERRHVIASYLSISRPARSFSDNAELGRFLSTAGHDEMIAAAWGHSPQQLRRCLKRAGDQPYRRSFYRYLFALTSADRRPAVTRLLSKLDRVDPTRLAIARALPDELCTPNVVGALKRVSEARDVARAYRLLRSAGVDHAGLQQAFTNVRTFEDIRTLTARWSLRVEFPPHPVPAVSGYRPCTTGEELRAMAVRLRNCGRTYVAKIMERRSALAVVTRGNYEAVVHLTRRDDRWMIDDVYGPRNDEPDPSLEEWTMAYLASFGVFRSKRETPEGEWASLRRLTGYDIFDLE